MAARTGDGQPGREHVISPARTSSVQPAAPARRLRTLGIALAVGLVLADSSIAVLALPAIRREYDVGLADLAWVLVTFNLALALAAMPAARVSRATGAKRLFTGGLALFAVASAACAIAPAFGVLLVGRSLQGIGGAAAVVAGLELLRGVVGSDRRAVAIWVAAGAAGAALGPAIGGLVTETMSWRAVFALQVPLALLAVPLVIALTPAVRAGAATRVRIAPNVGLGLLSAGLTAALFLIVLLLVEGWRLSPVGAAAVVTVLPLVAIATVPLARRVPSVLSRGVAGTVLVAGGLTSLALLPRAGWGWTLPPQLLVGAGLALAVAALTEAALDGRHPLELHGAVTIAARHAGVVVGLLVLTPVLVADLDRQRRAAEEAGAAAVFDSSLSPGTKVTLVAALIQRLDGTSGRIPDLGPTVLSAGASADEQPALEELARQLDDVLDRALTSSFSRSFLLAALLALGGLLATASGRRPRGVVLKPSAAAAAVVALAVPTGYLALGGGSYAVSKTADPCEPRALRPADSTAALAERLALAALDGASCELGVSREELALALASGSKRERFARDHDLRPEQVESAVRAGAVRAVDAAEQADAIDGNTATLLRGIALTLPLESLLTDLLHGA